MVLNLLSTRNQQSSGLAVASSSSAATSKYIKKNGVLKLNPDFYKQKSHKKQLLLSSSSSSTASSTASNTCAVTTVAKLKYALPIVSNLRDMEMLNSVAAAAKTKAPSASASATTAADTTISLAESTKATMELMQDEEFAMDAGFMEPGTDDNGNTMAEALGELLQKYEVPIGLMNKLLELDRFDSLEFLIDDSASMNMPTDHQWPVTMTGNVPEPGSAKGKRFTRWQEAQWRLQELMELIAYIPFTQINICFLNQPDRGTILTRKGRSPQAFLDYANSTIEELFQKRPMGITPYLERLRESFAIGKGKRIARYFMGDGLPDGGLPAIIQIQDILCHRQDPSGNPYTFLSCTDEDEQVEWMKHVEEVAPYCSEVDDFHDEIAEVLRDQGPALPFSRGFYLICSLVGAMNPDDLDAMDETVPFTKASLDNLLGIEHDLASYRHYWDCFVKAQKKRVNHGLPSDKYKKHMTWTEQHFQEFVRTPEANQIEAVREYKKHIQKLDMRYNNANSFLRKESSYLP